MWNWIKNHVFTALAGMLAAVWGAVTTTLNFLGVLTMKDQLSVAESYWFKFLDWWFSMPSWIPGICFAVTLIILASRGHPALVIAAEKLKQKPCDPTPAICASMRRASHKFRDLLDMTAYSNPPPERQFREEVGRWAVASLDLEKLGFPVPAVDFDGDYKRAMRLVIDYAERIEPLLNAGYIPQAKQKAAELAA